MKSKLIIITILTIFTFGCAPSFSPPSRLLTEDKMVEIGTQIRLVEAGLFVEHTRLYNEDSIRMQSQAIYDSLFKNQDITYQLYKENILYYTANPAVMSRIMKRVTENLSDI